MKLSHLQKRAAITAAAVILVAGGVAGRERPSMDIVQERAPAAAANDGIDLDKLRRGEASLPQTDLFSRKNWTERAPVAATAPEKPVAPPLPFQYIGKWTQGGKTEVLLMRDNELLPIEAGKKLGDYRVDKVSDASISFTYLPLKTKQSLSLETQ
jgi:hypothetical protein